MPQFKINWNSSTEENISTFDLNSEWFIIWCKYNGIIQLKRKNNSEKESVSGDLQIFEDVFDFIISVVKKEFSVNFLPGLSSIDILNFMPKSHSSYTIFGGVSITKLCEEKIDEKENEKLKEKIPIETVENRQLGKENQQNSLEKLSQDFERLLDPQTPCLADVILKCDSASIPAHKIILSARSPVFASMFTTPMKESIKNEVDIPDLEVSTLRNLLFYMYTGKTTYFSDSSVTDLLYAADKYQLQDLKAMCSDFLKKTMSLQTVIKILVLGDMFDEDLKIFAVKYICDNCAEFSSLETTEEWKSMQKERPVLAMDVLRSMVTSMNEKLKKNEGSQFGSR